MKIKSLIACLLLFLSVSLAAAEDTPEFPKPQKEHEWLQRFVGTWESESEAVAGPDQPAMKCKGALTTRSLGGFWVVTDMKSEMMGQTVTAVQTIGYDPAAKKYVGTWVDSMQSYLWKYEGTVDKAGTTLTLEAEGPNFMADNKLAKFRDVYEFKTKDLVAVTSAIQGEDGKWVSFMTGTARRKDKQ